MRRGSSLGISGAVVCEECVARGGRWTAHSPGRSGAGARAIRTGCRLPVPPETNIGNI